MVQKIYRMLGYPIKFKPILKEKIWGGNKLGAILNKKKATNNKVGESWELSGVENFESLVSNGKYKGESINNLIKRFKSDLVGLKNFENYGIKFPLLFKFLDASENLSIQLHPNDTLAKCRHNSYGKTEMWYVLDAEKEAKIYAGFSKEMTKSTFKESVQKGNVLDVIYEDSVKKGDVFFIESGTIHGIGKGVLVAEIQQTSDVTYRVFDWDRIGNDGLTRDLHLDLIYDALDFSKVGSNKVNLEDDKSKIKEVVDCKYFTTNKINLDNSREVRDLRGLDSFVVYMCVEGEGEFLVGDKKELIIKGDTILLPAIVNELEINPFNEIQLLEVYIK